MRLLMSISLAAMLAALPACGKEICATSAVKNAKNDAGAISDGWRRSEEKPIEDPTNKVYAPENEWVKHQDMAMYYWQIGKLRAAEDQCVAGIELGKKLEPGQLASLYGLLGNLLQVQGRYPLSIESFQKALELSKQDHNADKIDIALRELNLAGALLADGRTQDSIDVLVRVRSKLQPTDAGYGGLVQTLGKAYSDLNKLPEAEQTLQESVKVNLADGPLYDPGMAAESLFSLCIVYEKQNKNDAALACIEQAIPLAEKAFGPSDKRMQKIIHEKVMLNKDSEWNKFFTAGLEAEHDGKIMGAIDKFNEALKVIEIKDPNSNLMALSIASLGRAYAAAGENRKAEELLTRALPLYKRYYPSVVPGLERILNGVKQRLQ